MGKKVGRWSKIVLIVSTREYYLTQDNFSRGERVFFSRSWRRQIKEPELEYTRIFNVIIKRWDINSCTWLLLKLNDEWKLLNIEDILWEWYWKIDEIRVTPEQCYCLRTKHSDYHRKLPHSNSARCGQFQKTRF